MKALYCYFGALGTNFDADVPGHNFYQIPMIDALMCKYGLSKVDFYSYLPTALVPLDVRFPKTPLGDFCSKKFEDLIEFYNPSPAFIDDAIAKKAYHKIFLKARFRNLSTLTKKWNDAQQFEDFIILALNSGYAPCDIIVLDTDLSMSKMFNDWLLDMGITILTPSIDFQPMTRMFAMELYELNCQTIRSNHALFYGNLNFANYKAGNEKNSIVFDCLTSLGEMNHFDQTWRVTVAGKYDILSEGLTTVERSNRELIWSLFETSKLCLNVSKDKYVNEGFVPARAYEALMFGAIPVSYKMANFFPALSFMSVYEMEQIAKYILEIDQADYNSLYLQVLKTVTRDK